MDVFELRDQVTSDYSAYMRSFIEIHDRRVAQLVDDRLPELWPDPLIQLNPSFEPGERMEQLISDDLLHERCREIFTFESEGRRKPLRLYRHQIEGIRAARAGDNYILTTGTGSGKSLSYIVPIVDHVLRTPPEDRKGIQAIVVYPMNALANSQRRELEKYLGKEKSERAVSFARYTGQDDQDERRRILDDPPDILLTNYVMLELILTRLEERKLIAAAQDLRFLVFDELHTYRGRQGADVAMLCRRVQTACRAERLIHVGTSATLSSAGSWGKQQRAVAKVASQIFGVVVSPRRVIGETLRRATPELDLDDPRELHRLRARIESKPPKDDEEFINDPLSSWIESTLGLRLNDGRLVRQQPRALKQIAKQLATVLDREPQRCEDAIREALMAGYQRERERRPVFAFRLHQFISKGDTVYASLDAPNDRFLTLQPQHFVPGSERERVLLPLCFCRECGQDFYSVRRALRADGKVAYTSRDVADRLDSDDGEAGFLYLSTDKPWPHEHEAILAAVPESWLEERRNKLVLRRDRKQRLPTLVNVSSLAVEGHGDLEVAYFPNPFVFCPRCGVTYDTRQRSDFGKLGTLGSEGRSTATTILSLSTLRNLHGLPARARKLLSFTDNRQDAALQAGHFNDFVSLCLVRTGLYRALDQRGPEGIDHDALTQSVFEALDMPMRLYAVNPEVVYGQRERTQSALRRVLGYYLYRDLARGWRLTSPNLEQCGLLEVQYRDLHLFCADDEQWADRDDRLSDASAELRFEICTTLLNYLRRELAIFVDYLEPTQQEQVRLDANQMLINPWRLADGDQLQQSFVALIGSGGRKSLGKTFAGGRFVFVSPRGGFGQYLRRRAVLGRGGKFSLIETQEIIEDIAEALEKMGALRKVEVGRRGGKAFGYQISAASMIWIRGTNDRAAHDPIRVPHAPEGGLRPNQFFRRFYSDARDLAQLQAHEHTAQVRADVREQREHDFREAKLPLLFCSPTMELGVDIAELNIVNMRNVPPTPANYAQRSGRAGRSGQPAFVFTYCTARSPHDSHFFRNPERMVAGQVTTPRLDLANEDLLRAHIHAIWLAEAELALGKSLADLLDISGDEPTLEPRGKVETALNDRGTRSRALVRARECLGAELTKLHDGDGDMANEWLETTLETIPKSFMRACERWRSLFSAAKSQARRQQKILDDRSRPASERKQARRLREEAERQLDLLVDQSGGFNSDFYSYRYFASEGFLPGYNFPRLPLSAYLDSRQGRSRSEDDFLSRPRFLAVSEFGPRSIIYHEGARYVIGKVILGGELDRHEGEDSLLDRAARCEHCGAIEPVLGETAPDLCAECGAQLGPPTPNFFRMRNVTARRRDRITSDEEERLRIGYELRTSIHFPVVDGRTRRKTARLSDSKGNALATFTYGHSADVWRINMGWRRRKATEPPGFQLDLERGVWVKSQNPEDPDPDTDEPSTPRQERVIPYVKDTRNCLIVEPASDLGDEQMATLQAALKLAIQLEYQLEDRELAAEPLPSRQDRQRILFYEAAEGGAGVLRRLIEDKGALDTIAALALDKSHFDNRGNDRGRASEQRDPCEAACYDCLLSYYNQPDHSIVDRHLLPDLLLPWSGSSLEVSATEAPRESHLDTLLAACDSDLERHFLRFLDDAGHHLPTRAQIYLAEADTRVDFLYEPDQGAPVPVFVDGPPHDDLDTARRDVSIQEQLEDVGYLVIRFHHQADWTEIVGRYPSVFGAGVAEPTPVSEPAPVSEPEPEPSIEDLEEFLDDFFDPEWHTAIRQLTSHPEIEVEPGGELPGVGQRVAASYIARVERADQAVFIVDAAATDAETALRLVRERGDRVVALRHDGPAPLANVLQALED